MRVASESEVVIISVSILCLALSLRCQSAVNVNEFADNTNHQSKTYGFINKHVIRDTAATGRHNPTDSLSTFQGHRGANSFYVTLF